MDEGVNAFGELDLSLMVFILMDDWDVRAGPSVETDQSQYHYRVAFLHKLSNPPQGLNRCGAHQRTPLQNISQLPLFHPLPCPALQQQLSR